MNKDADVIVVGGGLFGSIISKALSSKGYDVIMFDDDRPMSGSKPSACLMKPGWFAGLGKEVHEPSLKLLDDLYKIEELQFGIYAGPLKVKTEKVFRVDPDKILHGYRDNYRRYKSTISHIEKNRVVALSPAAKLPMDFEADHIVVATGVWANELMKTSQPIQAVRGISYYWEGHLEEGIIKPWAPYKQLVAFQSRDAVYKENKVIWSGDGTAILNKNWTVQREDQCLARSLSILPHNPTLLETRQGLRPSVKKLKPCLFERTDDGIFIATGGAKNGTVAAGWCAHKILEMI